WEQCDTLHFRQHRRKHFTYYWFHSGILKKTYFYNSIGENYLPVVCFFTDGMLCINIIFPQRS
ncbi:MAG: hypothetical protein ACXVBZ_14620, partial [Flavisolibacter sp.]